MQSNLKSTRSCQIEMSEIRKILNATSPKVVNSTGRKEAAVALLLNEGLQGVELLFIERARRAGDPWSGQMAFPGGRREAQDADVLATAVRETSEEVGIELKAINNIGRLDDLIAPKLSHAHGLIISCHVFQLNHVIDCIPNEEVHDWVWLQLNTVLLPEHFTDSYQPPDYDGVFPGFSIGSQDPRVIWGLTYRIVCSFFRTLGITGY